MRGMGTKMGEGRKRGVAQENFGCVGRGFLKNLVWTVARATFCCEDEGRTKEDYIQGGGRTPFCVPTGRPEAVHAFHTRPFDFSVQSL